MTYAAAGNRDTAQRIINANADFVAYLVDRAGITAEEAARVLRFYVKIKAAKVDCVVGKVDVKHGAFLDRDVILRAVAQS